MFGCHKNFPDPIKTIDSKYYLPDDIWVGPFKPYFSGAAYVMTGRFLGVKFLMIFFTF